MTKQDIWRTFALDQTWLERFCDNAGPRIAQLYEEPTAELPFFLAEKLHRLADVEKHAFAHHKSLRPSP